MMRILMLLVLMLGAAAPLRAAEVNLNPEWGTAPYMAPSVFTPGIEDGAELPARVAVVFHGFKSAVPNGTFKRIHKALKKTHAVIGVNYDYFDIDGTVALLDALAARLDGREVAVIGTSLGGFWADWYGNRIAADKVVVLNPAVLPHEVLAKYIGTTVISERRAESFSVNAEQVARYARMPVVPQEGVRMLVLLTADDAFMDHRIAHDLYSARSGAMVRVYETGGHTINLKKHPAREAIRAFVQGE